MADAAVRTHDLTRRFDGRIAVDAVSMTVPERAVYGFLGRNGAGKTTTIRMLLGLIRASAGRAEICGIDVAKDRLAAARKVGALMEAHGFYANLSGVENLDLSRRLLGLPAGEVGRVLEVVDMTADGPRRVSDYSLGMRQRLGLARAMLGAPPLLILDEPTNGLDPDGIAEMRGFLQTLPERTGATVLLSSHLLGEIEQTASHIGVLNQGRLVLEGELKRLKSDLKPELAIQSDAPARVVALARSRGLGAVEADHGVVVKLARGDDAHAAAAALNRALVEAEVSVFALTPRQPTLEAIYREVVAPATTPDQSACALEAA